MNSLRGIFKLNWKTFLKKNPYLRKVEVHEVSKMLNCPKTSCNSRICSSCGKRYADQWSKGLLLFNVPHLHITLTVSSLLWLYLRKEKLKVFMDCAIVAVKQYFNKNFQLGCIVFLHTFGRDLYYKPHLHVLATKGGFCDGKFNDIKRLSEKRKLGLFWRNTIMANFDFEDLKISRILFRQFVTHITMINNKNKLIKYITRYSRHPVIANNRIISFNKKFVHCYYISHKTRKRVEVRKLNNNFINVIIQHIPERHFRIVRHYGVYAGNKKGFYL